MVLTPIPAEAPFVRLTIDLRPSDPQAASNRSGLRPASRRPGDAFHVVHEYAQERDLPRTDNVRAHNVGGSRQELRQIREEEVRAVADVGDGSRSLSRHGSFSGQLSQGSSACRKS